MRGSEKPTLLKLCKLMSGEVPGEVVGDNLESLAMANLQTNSSKE